MSRLAAVCTRVAANRVFHDAVLGLIITNAAVMGFETSPAVMQKAGPLLVVAGAITQALFVVEIAIRLAAFWPRPQRFFRDGWNAFDFSVVAASLLPQSGPFATVARLARVLRAARLISSWGELRLIIATMLRSIPSMGHVVALLVLLLYVYGVLGVHIFRDADPTHWGSLSRAVSSLFQILTLEGWVEIQKTSLTAFPWAWIFYWSFILVAVFVVMNLFIAVVINNLEAARDDENARRESTRRPKDVGVRAAGDAHDFAGELRDIRAALERIERHLGRG